MFQRRTYLTKNEFRARNLGLAVKKATRRYQPALERKSSTTIDAGTNGAENFGQLFIDVEEGQSYRISWRAEDSAESGTVYSIRINSADGHGSYRETFTNGGSWRFTARFTGTAEFDIGILFTSSSFFNLPVSVWAE